MLHGGVAVPEGLVEPAELGEHVGEQAPESAEWMPGAPKRS